MTMRARLTSLRYAILGAIWGPHLLAFLPALCLAAYWLIGEGGLIIVALGLPLLWALFGGFHMDAIAQHETDVVLSITPKERISAKLQQLYANAQVGDRSAVFAISLDDGDDGLPYLEDAVLHDLRDQMARRLQSLLRQGDLVVLSGHMQWIVALKPGPRLDLEVTIQQASRLQSCTDEPLFTHSAQHYFTSTAGFRLVRVTQEDPLETVVDDALRALDCALAAGPGSVRAHTAAQLAAPDVAQTSASTDMPLNAKGLSAWFQPQISTDTGNVCGFEALARMHHPERGVLPPAAFLPDMEKSGQMEKLSDIILTQSLDALASWDVAGLSIDTVGVNFAAQDLTNPRLYDKIAWELDRRDIPPRRLCIEILENVIASDHDDMITRNVSRLSDLGCHIDLDDFGTGHASISTLRRLPVSRLKIDRSFVARADLDSEQQKMVATILMMAERLGLSTLAEGVETVGEHAILAQLGCQYVQGYGVAKPMPFEQTIDWTQDYHTRVATTPRINSKTGS